MDQTDSELQGGDPVSDALLLFDALRLAIKDNQQLLFFDALRQTIKGNPQLAKKVLEIRDELAALIPPVPWKSTRSCPRTCMARALTKAAVRRAKVRSPLCKPVDGLCCRRWSPQLP